MSRMRLLVLAALFGLAAGAGVLSWRAAHRLPTPHASGVAAIGGPFRLVDQDGRPADESRLKGKWSAVFFGFTYCPDICPTTLQSLAQAQERLGDKAGDLQVVFVSVDPARDTPAKLKTYLSSPAFPKGVLGLTGSPAQVDAAAKAYKAYYQKEGEGADYVVNHTSVVYLMDPNGRFSRVLAYSLTPEEIARQVSDAMRQGAAKT